MPNSLDSITQQQESCRVSEAIDSFTRCYIRKQSRQLVGKRGFHDADREDIEQQLYLKLTPYLHQADPESPRWKAFVAKTVGHQIVSMIRHNEREMRDHRRVGSIHELVAGDDNERVEMAHAIGEDETPGRRSRVRRTDQDCADLRIDLDACIEGLEDPRFRDFCERLKHDSIARVASDLGIPRTTANAWLAKIRAQLRDHELAKTSSRDRQFFGPEGS